MRLSGVSGKMLRPRESVTAGLETSQVIARKFRSLPPDQSGRPALVAIGGKAEILFSI
jgi:hypothetical protein